MLDLYHAEPAANSLKVLVAFKEKGLDFNSHFVNLHKFEQHEDGYLKINPNGQVPALVHDGGGVTESTVINEYVDEVFPDVPLKPDTPLGRARMRIWTKFVDEYFCPALSHLAWHYMIRGITDSLTEQQFEEYLSRIPLKEQRDKWRISAEQGNPPEQLEEWRRKVKVSVDRMETTLKENKWLAGDTFSLADVACFAMSPGLPQRFSEFANEKDTPHFIDWLNRMHERDGVKAALNMPNPLQESGEAPPMPDKW